MIKNKHKNLIFLILIIACVAVISGCIKKEVKPVVVNNTDSVNVENSSTDIQEEPNEENEKADEIDTSDWLTYKNEEYGYQINYPKDWRVKFPSLLGKTKKDQMIRITGGHYTQYYAPLEIFVHDGKGKSFEDWHTSMYSHPIDIDKLKKSQRIIHNDTEFVLFNDEFGPRYYAIKNDKFVNLTTTDSFVDEEKGRKMMETMVFSFKFID